MFCPSEKNIAVLFIIIFGTLSFPIGHARQRLDYASYRLAAAKLGQLVLGKFWTQAFQ